MTEFQENGFLLPCEEFIALQAAAFKKFEQRHQQDKEAIKHHDKEECKSEQQQTEVTGIYVLCMYGIMVVLYSCHLIPT